MLSKYSFNTGIGYTVLLKVRRIRLRLTGYRMFESHVSTLSNQAESR